MTKCLQALIDNGQGVFVKKRKKAPKAVPAPAALFDAESEDEQPVQPTTKKRKKANLNPGLRILDTDSEGEDNAIEAIKIRVCCHRSRS